MASASVFGGGFFYNPFTQTIVQTITLLIPGAGLANFSAYLPVQNPTAFKGRWLQLQMFAPAQAGTYHVQLSIGASGFEVPWQPTGGNPGRFIFLVNVGLTEPALNYNFPISLERGVRLAARASTNGGPTAANFTISIWG